MSFGVTRVVNLDDLGMLRPCSALAPMVLLWRLFCVVPEYTRGEGGAGASNNPFLVNMFVLQGIVCIVHKLV